MRAGTHVDPGGVSAMVRLDFHDPSGAIGATAPHARRLASLEGTRLGFLSNEQWQAYRMLHARR